MPSTRPGLLGHDWNYGVYMKWTCQACVNFDKREDIDWDSRANDLERICEQYRGTKHYDVMCPVSGGKDSHFIVQKMRELGMNPLLVKVADPFTETNAGKHNFDNLKEVFNCDSITYEIGRKAFRKATKYSFEAHGAPLDYLETAIYTVPAKIAIDMGIPLVIYGENSAYEYGTAVKDKSYAGEDISMRLKRDDIIEYWTSAGLIDKELYPVLSFEGTFPTILYMSYFYPWSSVAHLEVAKRHGFRGITHEWKREGAIEDFESIDCYSYPFYLWLKYPKFGFQRVTDIVSRRIREGYMDRDKGKKLILENDHKLDPLALQDFAEFCGYSIREVYSIVDTHYNKDLFKQRDGVWKLKEARF